MQTICEELKSNGVRDEQIIYIDLDSRNMQQIKKADDLEKMIENTMPVETC